jgi:hypothetical protein
MIANMWETPSHARTPAQVSPSPELLAHANQVIEAWSLLSLHPNLSTPRLAFVSLEIGGQPCLYLGHDYHPAAATLEASHLQPQVTASGLVQVTPMSLCILQSEIQIFVDF